MQIEKNDLVTLENNRKYLVLSKVEYKDEFYLYLTSTNEPYEIVICKIIDDELEVITNEDLINKLSVLFYKDIANLLK